jgi:hypothetical protein
LAGNSEQTIDVEVTSLVLAAQQAKRRSIALALANPNVTQSYVICRARESGPTGPRLLVRPPMATLSADSYVQGGASASTNFGSSPELRIKKGTSMDTTREAYLKFDISAAPAYFGRATLRVFSKLSSTNSSNVAARVFGVVETGWDGSTIVWNNKPAIGSGLGSFVVLDTTARWLEVDVTSYVRSLAASGQHDAALALAAPAVSSASIIIASSESGSNPPELVFGPAPPLADAYVQGGTYAATNFGSAPDLLVKLGSSLNTTREGYLKFEIPSNVVSSVIVRFYARVLSSDNPRVATTVFGVGNTSWQASTLTWNNRPTGGTALGSVTVEGTAPRWVALDITDYVRTQASAGRATITLALRNLAQSTSIVGFSSLNGADHHPELIVR